MVCAIPLGWPGLITKCRSISSGIPMHWSLTGRSGIIESTIMSWLLSLEASVLVGKKFGSDVFLLFSQIA